MIATVAAGIFMFARVSGLLMTMPALGSGIVPRLARLGAAAPLTLVLLPAGADTRVPETLGQLVAGVGSEFILGIAMGTVVSIAFGSLGSAAELLSTQGGLHIGSMLDPLTLSQPGALGLLASWLGTGVFFGAGLHLQCIQALAESFAILPPGTIHNVASAGEVLVPATGVAVALGITLAGPLVIFVFLVNLGLSILSRMAPGLQLFFAVGPSFTVVASLALLLIALQPMLAAWLYSLPESVAAILVLADLAR